MNSTQNLLGFEVPQPPTIDMTVLDVRQLPDLISWMYIQLALLSGAFALFFPIGVTLAWQKWIWGESKFLGLRVWFHLHRLVQLLGVGAFVASITIYFVKINAILPNIEKMQEVYYVMMISLSGALGAQLALTLLRPPNDHSKRALWNNVHRLLGILTILTGWAAVYIGVYNLHQSIYEPYVRWLAPISGTIFVIILCNIVAMIMKKKSKTKDEVEVVAPIAQ